MKSGPLQGLTANRNQQHPGCVHEKPRCCLILNSFPFFSWNLCYNIQIPYQTQVSGGFWIIFEHCWPVLLTIKDDYHYPLWFQGFEAIPVSRFPVSQTVGSSSRPHGGWSPWRSWWARSVHGSCRPWAATGIAMGGWCLRWSVGGQRSCLTDG